MRVECAWCRKAMGGKPGRYDAVSHGICDECSDKMITDAKAWREARKMEVRHEAGRSRV